MSGRGSPGGASRRVILDPTALFKALAEADIEYILIGGLAVAAHGAIRATGDLDICPDPDHSNLKRLADLLDELEAVSVDAGALNTDELIAHDYEGLKGGANFRLSTKLGALDVMRFLDPFEDDTWKVLSKHAEERQVFGETIRVCSFEDLLEMKEAAGRDQDLIDVKNIKAARREL